MLEGLNGKPVTAICQDYHLSQAQCYQWRDRFPSNAAKPFEVARQTEREARLQHENARLKKLLGELTLKLKKATRRCGHDPPSLASRRSAQTARCWRGFRR